MKNEYVGPAGATLTDIGSALMNWGVELQYYGPKAVQGLRVEECVCTRNKANRTITREASEHLMEAMARRMKQQPEKFKLRKTLAEHPFWHDQSGGFWLHALFIERTGQGAVRMEPDNPDLQPQTGAKPGELPKTDGGGGLKARRQRLSAKNGSSRLAKCSHSSQHQWNQIDLFLQKLFQP